MSNSSSPVREAAIGELESPVIMPAEMVIESLLGHFVAPLLPRRRTSRDLPTVQQQNEVGKQMHAVVVLYNYYQRKQSPKSDFLDFVSFCETACISKPFLLDYMKYMCSAKGSLEDAHRQLSITEMMVMDACDICSALDETMDAFPLDEWPITKVAVFLVDLTRKKCFLKKDNIIKGSWSLFEKDLKTPLDKLLTRAQLKSASIYRSADESSRENASDIEDVLQIAYSVVEQETGIKRANLSILGSHSSFSLSHWKSSTRLYIIAYNVPGACNSKLKWLAPVEVSIEDVISLHGLPVRFSHKDKKPEITSVAEHYCLLPYIDIIDQWFSRKLFQDVSLTSPKQTANLVKFSDGPVTEANHDIRDNGLKRETSEVNYSYPMLAKDFMDEKYAGVSVKTNLIDSDTPCHTVKPASQSVNMNVSYSDVIPVIAGHESSHKHIKGKVNSDCEFLLLEQNAVSENCPHGIPLMANHEIGEKSDCSEEQITVNCLIESGTANEVFHNISSGRSHHVFSPRIQNHTSSFKEQMVLSTVNENTNDATSFLVDQKRDVLIKKKRKLEDEVNGQLEGSLHLNQSSPPVDHNQKPLNGDNLTHNGKNSLAVDDLLLIHDGMKDKVLDEIFSRNNWISPKYSVFPLPEDGKYQALIAAKGFDFECTIKGDHMSSPSEARDSAAACMLTKLQEMAAQGHAAL
ncbi:hypothetical protein AXF42_Ash018512 [Apostasia shenzhenica]|uniref:DRBM domain-containing protein n=1 Tax=Apostasia shenzhenica TaxID=1088818 RepID=A0A2H9ZZG6_9ASPA|nr:hypothetical protein AXF42_Ash018512 [Apostasia shenzhenica]